MTKCYQPIDFTNNQATFLLDVVYFFHTFKLKSGLIVAIINLLLIYSCNDPASDRPKHVSNVSYDKLRQVEWILGKWENNVEGTLNLETWARLNDSSFGGSSYLIESGDTISEERISIAQQGNILTYNPTVTQQNSGQTIVFTSSSMTEHQVIFENHSHDFPQIISYSKINNDSIFAEISGKYKGSFKKISFPFRRVKPNS